MSQLLALMALGLASGLLIGCIGIGGVILVPALVFVGGIPIQRAIPAALLAYIVSAVVATVIYAREKSIHWNMAAWLCIAAAPAAFAGAWAVKNANARLLEVLIGVLTTVSGINSLRPAHRRVRKETHSHTAVVADRRRHRVRFIDERHGRATCPRSDPDGVQSPGAHRHWAQSGHPASDRGRWQPRQLSLWRT